MITCGFTMPSLMLAATLSMKSSNDSELVDAAVMNTGCFKQEPIAPYKVTPLSLVLLRGI